jgi:NAD(P)-dependent dehydrogenase (short-subunit alcohol dehydrogenase family)
VAAFAHETRQQMPHLAILINNAGVALQGQFAEVEPTQIEWLMGVNFWGVVYANASSTASNAWRAPPPRPSESCRASNATSGAS